MANADQTAPSSSRERNHRRIAVATRGLAATAAAATAVFTLAAAQTTGTSPRASAGESSSLSESSQSGEEDSGWTWLSPSQSPPQQSFGAPVAGSGGS
jgi:hypothetical protein